MSYEYDISHNSGNLTAERDAPAVFGMPRIIEGYTLHYWGDANLNPSYEGVRDYLCRPGGNTSAHIVATGTGRRASCIVGYNDVAWHSGSAWGNARTIGIELDPRAREEDKDVFAEVLADLRSAFGDLPLYWHSYFTATTCPGPYQALIDDLDQRSYQKISGAEWGHVTNKNTTPTPTPTPVPPPVTTPTTTPQPVAFKVFDASGSQVGAYNVEANAYNKFVVATNKQGKIKQGVKDVTAELLAKYETPSPTTKDPATGDPLPDTGLPVTEKHDYSEENNGLLKQILAILQSLFDKFTGIFK